MRGTNTVVMGDRGRLVVPAEVRQRAGFERGTVLVISETEDGLLLMTREQLERRVRASLAGHDVVGELLAERRAAAAAEDALALGDRLDRDVLTADAAWGDDGRIKQIRGD